MRTRAGHPSIPEQSAPQLTRRTFLAAALGASAVVLTGCGDDDGSSAVMCADAMAAAGTLPAGNLFSLGVASGDPLHDRVVLWTRLKLSDGVRLPDVDIPVQWEVARDEDFDTLVACGTTVAVPTYAHSVHVDATGLSAQTTYWYRFRVGDHTSPTGRTRTWPAPTSDPARVKFAFASCQRWEEGYYTAYPHLVEEDGVEFVVWLGDYIYETSQDGVRPTTFGEARTLDDYRMLYELYKSDPALQAAHAAYPWVITWDDHEFVDDYVGDGAEDDRARRDPVLMAQERARRFQAYQAWWEHQPLRLEPPTSPDYRIYRTIPYGRLANFHVLDTRQYRSKLECYYDFVGPRCPNSPAADTKMLGDEQEAWLFDALSRSATVWNVLAQGVVMTETPAIINQYKLFNYDQWDGFAADRARLLGFLEREAIANPVVITGDIHMAGVGDLRVNFDDPAAPTVGTELVCSSMSGDFPTTFIGIIEDSAAVTPQVKYVNPRKRGYVVCEVTRGEWIARFRAVDTVKEPVSDIQTDVVFRIRAGTAGAERVHT